VERSAGIPPQPSCLSRLHVCVIQQREFHDDQTDDAARRFQGRARALDSYSPAVKEGWFDARLASLTVRLGIMDLTGTGLWC
jgi:hypothetical protein